MVLRGLVVATMAVSVGFGAATASAQTFREASRNGLPMTFEDGIYTAHVTRGACDPTPYPEMTESDCEGGNRRSQRHSGTGARQGESWEYGFQFRVPEDFDYIPTELNWEMGSASPDQRFMLLSRMNIAEWKKNRPKNHIYHLKLDAALGSTFLDRVCAGPETFGTWVDFRMTVKWGRRGFLRVSCNDEVIYEALTDTAVTPFCIPALHCEGDIQSRRGWINQPLVMHFGLTAEVNTYGLLPIVDDAGQTLQLREVYANRTDDPTSAYVERAQQALLDAGFDPSGVDGKAGPGTRRALQAFQEAKGLAATGEFDEASSSALGLSIVPLPTDSGVASPDLLRVVEAAQAELAALDPAALAEGRPFVARLVAEDIFDEGGTVVALVASRLDGVSAWRGMARFSLIANIADDAITALSVKFARPLGSTWPASVSVCANALSRNEGQGEGGQYFPVFRLERDGDGYAFVAGDCVAGEMPPVVGYQLRMLTVALDRIAGALVETGQVKRMKSKPLAIWLEAVAMGDIVISRDWLPLPEATGPTVGQLAAAGGGTMLAQVKVTHYQPTDMNFGWLDTHYEVSVLDVRADGSTETRAFTFATRGNFSAVGRFNAFDIVVTRPLDDATAAALADCGSMRMTVTYGDDKHRLRIGFTRRGGAYKAESADCIREAVSDPEVLFAVDYLLTDMQGFARGMFEGGHIAQVKRRGLDVWLRKVADGEITFQ